MSGPFNIGDVVVCVDDSPCRRPDLRGRPFPFKRGAVLKVSYTCLDINGAEVVRFTSGPKPSGPGYVAERFRHLPKADDQFIQQMRAIKPVREGVSA